MAPILAFCPVPDAVPERVAGHPVRHADGAQSEEPGARFWKSEVPQNHPISLPLQRCGRRNPHMDTLHVSRHQLVRSRRPVGRLVRTAIRSLEVYACAIQVRAEFRGPDQTARVKRGLQAGVHKRFSHVAGGSAAASERGPHQLGDPQLCRVLYRVAVLQRAAARPQFQIESRGARIRQTRRQTTAAPAR
ncbi:hypothetical protein KL919_005133 [Ogataea angusta]|uniref:Uncharacterized protein n=1 Tax=Pichia angusta TaxID=870730 RepID=A0ABQ7RRJ3_PICAN|nr:hypothetical protein KL943_001014 [Ogataea angusta]KAG7846179.1 hypothetical protein KL940_004463 [Ogataea angusta]KAG7854339.1 hypothetical protein KL919_005133 [Ogataea angusta]